MGAPTRITIIVPAELLDAVERSRTAQQESRDEFFARAAQSLLRVRRQADLLEQDRAGYERFPETEEEARVNATLAPFAFTENPWDAEG